MGPPHRGAGRLHQLIQTQDSDSNSIELHQLMPEIRQEVDKQTFFYPPLIIEGTKEAEDWLRESRKRLGNALQSYRAAIAKKAELKETFQQTELSGSNFARLDLKAVGSFNLRLAQCNRIIVESQNLLENFKAQQADFQLARPLQQVSAWQNLDDGAESTLKQPFRQETANLCEFCLNDYFGSVAWEIFWRQQNNWHVSYHLFVASYIALAQSANACCWICSQIYDLVAGSGRGSFINVEFQFWNGPRNGDMKECSKCLVHVYPHEQISDRTRGKIQIRVAVPKTDPSKIFARGTVPKQDFNNFHSPTARTWLDECVRKHEWCRKSENDIVPSRLLRLNANEDVVYLQEVSQQASTIGENKIEYAALSYCWGRSHPMVTTRSNVIEHCRGINIATLPKTFQDALLVTRLLGMQLLWIDALCIVQDDEADMTEQLSRMKSYYQNAKVTLANTRAMDVGQGFLKAAGSDLLKYIELKNQHVQLPTGCQVPYYDKLGMKRTVAFEVNIIADDDFYHLDENDGHYDEQREPLNTRAWTLQERWLSPRILSFPSFDGFVFQCNTEERFAGDYCLDDAAEKWDESVIRRRLRFGAESLDPEHREFDVEQERFKAQAEWIYIVQAYARRNLSDPLDKLSALGGLAELFHSQYETALGSYAAGHWFKMLPLSLCWKVFHQNLLASPQQYRAPSWSWAAVDSEVYFQLYHHDSLRPTIGKFAAKVSHLHIEPSSSKVPFGAVKHAGLQLNAAVLTATWHGPNPATNRWDVMLEDGEGSDLVPIRLGAGWPDTIESRPLVPRRVKVLILGLVSSDMKEDNSQMLCLIIEEVSPEVFKRTGSLSIGSKLEEMIMEHSQWRNVAILMPQAIKYCRYGSGTLFFGSQDSEKAD